MSTSVNKASSELAEAVGSVVLLWTLAIGLVCVRAWVIASLWAWYVVPGFHLAPLPISVAFGLSTLAMVLVPPYTRGEKPMTATTVSQALFHPLFILFLGWVGSFFV